VPQHDSVTEEDGVPGVHEELASLRDSVAREVVLLEQQRQTLVEIQASLVGLSAHLQDAREVEATTTVIPPEHVSAQTEQLLDGAEIVRTCVLTLDVGPGVEDAMVREVQARMRGGMVQRALYPLSIHGTDDGRRWMRAWAEAGEQQRLVESPPSEFAVFGEGAVVASVSWEDPSAGYRLIRDAAIVRAYTALFDAVWAVASVVPSAGRDAAADDLRLLELLDQGFKDEAIARHLGWGLRSVRRRVATLMAEHGVDTRFQLGASTAFLGLLDESRARRRRELRGGR
jgi:hypothetical protein